MDCPPIVLTILFKRKDGVKKPIYVQKFDPNRLPSFLGDLNKLTRARKIPVYNFLMLILSILIGWKIINSQSDCFTPTNIKLIFLIG